MSCLRNSGAPARQKPVRRRSVRDVSQLNDADGARSPPNPKLNSDTTPRNNLLTRSPGCVLAMFLPLQLGTSFSASVEPAPTWRRWPALRSQLSDKSMCRSEISEKLNGPLSSPAQRSQAERGGPPRSPSKDGATYGRWSGWSQPDWELQNKFGFRPKRLKSPNSWNTFALISLPLALLRLPGPLAESPLAWIVVPTWAPATCR